MYIYIYIWAYGRTRSWGFWSRRPIETKNIPTESIIPFRKGTWRMNLWLTGRLACWQEKRFWSSEQVLWAETVVFIINKNKKPEGFLSVSTNKLRKPVFSLCFFVYLVSCFKKHRFSLGLWVFLVFSPNWNNPRRRVGRAIWSSGRSGEQKPWFSLVKPIICEAHVLKTCVFIGFFGFYGLTLQKPLVFIGFFGFFGFQLKMKFPPPHPQPPEPGKFHFQLKTKKTK